MSVTGLCQICESAEARHACERCGLVVCREHHDAETGYCTQCTADVNRSRGGNDGRDGDGPRFV